MKLGAGHWQQNHDKFAKLKQGSIALKIEQAFNKAGKRLIATGQQNSLIALAEPEQGSLSTAQKLPQSMI